MQDVLRVIGVPGHLIADDLAYQNNNRFRYVGRSPTPIKTDNPENLELRFPLMEREYPNDHNHRQYIFRALQKGSLLPCDEFTAREAKVRFNKPRVEKNDRQREKSASSAAKAGE
jgi:hypothetical protein